MCKVLLMHHVVFVVRGNFCSGNGILMFVKRERQCIHLLSKEKNPAKNAPEGKFKAKLFHIAQCSISL